MKKYNRAIDFALLAMHYTRKAEMSKSAAVRASFKRKAVEALMNAGRQHDVVEGMRTLEASLRLAAENEDLPIEDEEELDVEEVEAEEAEDIEDEEELDVEEVEAEEEDDDDDVEDDDAEDEEAVEEAVEAFNRIAARVRKRRLAARRIAARRLAARRMRR